MNNGDLKKDNDWVKIFTTPDQFKAQFIHGMLEEKAESFDYGFQKKCVEERNYEALEMYVMELLLTG